MKKLFSTHFGSGLYGTKTPTSDVDLKYVVLPDLRDLLLGKRVENVVKKTNSAKNTRNSADDVDQEFLPVQKFARGFFDGQTQMLEVAFSVGGDQANQQFFDHQTGAEVEVNELFLQFVEELKEKFLTSNVKALVGYAVNQANLYSFKGERLACAQEFKELVVDYKQYFSVDEMKITTGDLYTNSMVENAVRQFAKKYPKYFKVTEYAVSETAKAPCFVLLEKTLPFSNSVWTTLQVVQNLLNKYGQRSKDASESNVDWKATMHALRVVDEGVQLLRDGYLEFPFEKSRAEYFLKVKRGEVPLEEVKSQLDEKLEELKNLQVTTTAVKHWSHELEQEFEAWLGNWMFKFYNLSE